MAQKIMQCNVMQTFKVNKMSAIFTLAFSTLTYGVEDAFSEYETSAFM